MEEHLSKGQRRKLKREQQKRERKLEMAARERVRNIGKVKKYAIAALVILVVVGFFYWRSIPPKNGPILDVEPTTYSFGPVSQSFGAVSGMMTLSNNGNEDLIINNMDTSCGCTSASIVADEIEGPKFSMAMHGTNPTDWIQVVLPGESVQLKVYYDPNVHKDMRGAVSRSVFIYSNDPRYSKQEVRITATQTS